jgi:hypothetical protein
LCRIDGQDEDLTPDYGHDSSAPVRGDDVTGCCPYLDAVQDTHQRRDGNGQKNAAECKN